jgi:hypothetical protein
MAGGLNVGTLGGEDVMHDEFSYEAKTYKKDCKTNKNQDWMGERVISKYDQGLASIDIALVRVTSMYYPPLILVRWAWWEKIVTGNISRDDIYISMHNESLTKFRGETYMKQAEKNCPDAKMPIVVVHTTGRRHPQDIVIIREIYFDSLIEKLFDK